MLWGQHGMLNNTFKFQQTFEALYYQQALLAI